MHLLVVQNHLQVQRRESAFPRIILERGSRWDDSGYSTLFDVYFQGEESAHIVPLGSAKILRRGQKRTELPADLAELPEDSCSLGQTLDYYTAIHKLTPACITAVVSALRDIVFHPEYERPLEAEPGVNASLRRFSEANRIYVFRDSVREMRRIPEEPIRFRFVSQLPHFVFPHELDLDFDPRPQHLGRMMAVIGESGAGKTTLLANLAAALWGLDRQSELSPRPPTGRVIAVSCCILDQFRRPPQRIAGSGGGSRNAFDNYHYLGFRRRTGDIDPDWQATAKSAFESLGARGLAGRWRSAVSQVGIHVDDSELPSFGTAEGWNDLNQRLGAGQKIALFILTQLLEAIRDGSFLLLDEPESNLHPRLLSNFLRVVYSLLDEFRSYCVVATHSPLVVQEIPGRMLRIVEVDQLIKQGELVPNVRLFRGESFGEDLSTIASEVFGLKEPAHNYASILRSWSSSGVSEAEIQARLGRPLSLNARLALNHISSPPSEGGDHEEA